MSGEGSVAGSKIRLISKSMIRYEGTLSEVDGEKNTVSLDNVRIFGTEDRPAERKVGPMEEVYNQVVFKGADINQLLVLEDAPKPGPMMDPAVVRVSNSDRDRQAPSSGPGHVGGPAPSAHIGSSRSGMSGMFDDFGGPSSRGNNRYDYGGKGGGGGGGGGNRDSSYWQQPQDHYGRQNAGWNQRDQRGYDMRPNQAPRGPGMYRGSAPGGKGGFDRHDDRRVYDDRRYDDRRGGGGGGGGGGDRRGYGGKRGGYGGGKGSRGGARMGGGRMMNSGHTGMNFQKTNEAEAADLKAKMGDFDFNAVSDKSKELKDNEKDEEVKKITKSHYNKESSFYDALQEEKSEPHQRLTMKERQKYHDDDVATFGKEAVAGVERSFQRNRRGMRK